MVAMVSYAITKFENSKQMVKVYTFFYIRTSNFDETFEYSLECS